MLHINGRLIKEKLIIKEINRILLNNIGKIEFKKTIKKKISFL
jgi:hypothetical protein